MRNKKEMNLFTKFFNKKKYIYITLQSRISISSYFYLLFLLMIWVLLNNAVVWHTCAARDTKSRMWFHNFLNHIISSVIYTFLDINMV